MGIANWFFQTTVASDLKIGSLGAASGFIRSVLGLAGLVSVCSDSVR